MMAYQDFRLLSLLEIMNNMSAFVISELSREDIERLGFTGELDDEVVQGIADEMGRLFLETEYWTLLEMACTNLDIPFIK